MGNFMVGGKVSGNDEGAYEVQEAAAYRYKSCVVSASCCEKHTVLNTALFAAPYKNVLFGATCKLSLKDAVKPAIAFGVCIKPSLSNEVRVKVDAEGKLGMFYKQAVTDFITASVTGSVDFNNVLGGTHRMGFGLEIRV